MPAAWDRLTDVAARTLVLVGDLDIVDKPAPPCWPNASPPPASRSCPGTGPAGGKNIDKVARTTYYDMLRAALTRRDPKEFLFFNRNATGKRAAKAFVERLKERTADRDKPITVKAFQTQLKAIKRWGRSAPADLSKITQPTLIANGDNDRMVPSVLSDDLHRRIKDSELIIYPDSGHGGIFQFHDQFVPVVLEFLDR